MKYLHTYLPVKLNLHATLIEYDFPWISRVNCLFCTSHSLLDSDNSSAGNKMDDRPTPVDADIPGGYPETPASIPLSQHRQHYADDVSGEATPTPRAEQTSSTSYFGRPATSTDPAIGNVQHEAGAQRPISGTRPPNERSVLGSAFVAPGLRSNTDQNDSPTLPVAAAFPARQDSDETLPVDDTLIANKVDKNPNKDNNTSTASSSSSSSSSSASSSYSGNNPTFAPVRSQAEIESPGPVPSRPALAQRATTNGSTRRFATEDDLFRALSRRRTATSHVGTDLEAAQSDAEETAEIERLMSRLFGKARQEQSHEEQTRHAGVVFRHLTVKGAGLGASLQPTVGDIFVGPARFAKKFFTKGFKAATGKPPVRDLLSDFNGCVRPGEMLLVLGRPGSGCTTFLKAFCNQRAGFVDVLGDVTYGGASAKEMEENYRSELSYNPEEDLHFATLTVQRTLSFALQTKTPGKASRLEGETREDYEKEFLRVTSKLLWIEHTMGTKVGDENIRGVSGGERKRVSIAEAMIARSSVAG